MLLMLLMHEVEHPWLREGGEASNNPIDSAVLIRMKQFRAMNKLQKLALKVMAENLPDEEIKGLKQMFNNIDTDRSGTITLEELKAGLTRLGSRLTEPEIQQLMEAADVDKNGSIDYMEFITATMHRHRLDKEENLYKTFQYFDKDDSGLVCLTYASFYFAPYWIICIADISQKRSLNKPWRNMEWEMRQLSRKYLTMLTLTKMGK